MTILDTALQPEPPRGRRPGRRRRSDRRAWPALLALLVAVALGAALAYGAVVGGQRVLSAFTGAPDYEGEGTGSVVVAVPEGGTLTALADELVALDVVLSRAAFLEAARSDERASSLVPGSYALREQMSSEAAVDLLLDPASRETTTFTVPEGLELAQVVDLLVEEGFSREELGAALADTGSLDLPDWADGTVEGFLFPATYELSPGATARDVVQQMAAEFTRRAELLDLEARAREQGRDPFDVVVLASLAQEEAKTFQDYRRVVRVALNRLEVDMPLQFDSTVNYVLPPDERGNPTLGDLEVQSEYNTYAVTGLPPTPIAAAGDEALEAALDPAAGDWIYFLTTNTLTGETFYTTDYDAFINEKNALKERRDAGDPTAQL